MLEKTGSHARKVNVRTTLALIRMRVGAYRTPQPLRIQQCTTTVLAIVTGRFAKIPNYGTLGAPTSTEQRLFHLKTANVEQARVPRATTVSGTIVTICPFVRYVWIYTKNAIVPRVRHTRLKTNVILVSFVMVVYVFPICYARLPTGRLRQIFCVRVLTTMKNVPREITAIMALA